MTAKRKAVLGPLVCYTCEDQALVLATPSAGTAALALDFTGLTLTWSRLATLAFSASLLATA